MEFKFRTHKQYSRKDVAKAFNKTIYNIATQSRKYKANGGRKGLLNSNQQVPFVVFASRIIRNTPEEFWGFFLDDNNFTNFDIVKD